MKKIKKTFSKERLDNLDKAIGNINKEFKVKKELKKLKYAFINWQTQSSLNSFFKKEYGDKLEELVYKPSESFKRILDGTWKKK